MKPLQIQIRKLGLHGRAYDDPGLATRAYTYIDQPNNVEAHKLGRAAHATISPPASDYIDGGLSLLKHLAAEGFGVYELEAAASEQHHESQVEERGAQPAASAAPVQLAWRVVDRETGAPRTDWIDGDGGDQGAEPVFLIQRAYAASAAAQAQWIEHCGITDVPDAVLTSSGLAIKKAQASESAQAQPFDFAEHLQRQRNFSEKTFGPGRRTAGVCDHIRKELREIESAPDDVTEWIDVVILALDGAWRTGALPQQIIEALVAKQTKNEGRNWPDWRTQPLDKAIEHTKAGAQQPVSGADGLLAAICDAFHIGSAVRTPETVMANVENAIRRSRCLGVVEQHLTLETPPDPDEGDDEPGEECLLRWGAEPDTYAEHFSAALAQFLAAQSHLYDGDTLTAAYMAGLHSARPSVPEEPAPILYQHTDGRYGLCLHGRPAAFTEGDPAWYRVPIDLVESSTKKHS